MKTKASLLFFIAGVVLWMIKLMMGLESTIWLTFVLGAAGLIFAIAGRTFILMILNALLMVSVFVLMLFGN